MTEPRRVRTQAERATDDHTWRHHEHGEQTAIPGEPLPPVPDCCYPPDAVDLPPLRRRWWHRYTRRAL
ncbi:MAG TPA: hypothetical protein VIQ30_08900 [Pseudonocardia sp.]